MQIDTTQQQKQKTKTQLKKYNSGGLPVNTSGQ
jgi:hypothetical protein